MTLAGCLLLCLGCNMQSAPPAKAVKPATVAQIADEAKLATIELTPQADERLGVRTVALVRKKVPRMRTFGGETQIPPGHAIVVTAPVSGTLSMPLGGRIPRPGSKVAQGDVLFHWTPLLTPPERVRLIEARASLAGLQIDAERQVESAKLQLEAAQVALTRAQKLLADKAGTQRAVDEARSQFSLAREALAGAESRHQLLSKTNFDTDSGMLRPLEITAPMGGLLRKIDVTPGQTVAAGALLFEIVEANPMWVRVPLYVGGMRDVDTEAAALVSDFGDSAAEGRAARPIDAPPSADPLAATVDLHFELPNADGHFRPGQKLAVTVTLKSEDESLVAPWSSVLHDIHGGAWIYEQTAPRTYVRRRVVVRYINGSDAILATGPAAGTNIVTDGAAELFGTEFGFGK